jgi:hypothetical protein
MCGAIIPLPNTPAWRGAQLKQREVLMIDDDDDDVKMTAPTTASFLSC